MYEMEGPCPGQARSRTDDSAASAVPGQPPDLGCPASSRQSPGSPSVPQGAPGDGPVFGGEECSTACSAVRTRVFGN